MGYHKNKQANQSAKRKPLGKSPVKAGRNGMIAKVHIAKKDLGLDDDTYRTILIRHTGRRSCSDMSIAELELLLKAFVIDYGWTAGKKHKPTSHQPQIKAIFGLWFQLCDMGVFHVKTRTAVKAWVQKQSGVSDPNWLTPEQAVELTNQLRKIIRDTDNGKR